MAEESESKAHLWIFSGLVLVALAVVLPDIIGFDRAAYLRRHLQRLRQQRTTEQQAIGADDDQIAAMIEKHPPLEAWYRFAKAVVWSGLEDALAATCEGPTFDQPEPRKHDLKSLSTDDLLRLVTDFDKTYEVILVRAGFLPKFGFVYEKAPDHYIIEAAWQLDSLSSFDYYYRDNQTDAQRRGQLIKALEKTEAPQQFEFYKIDEQWYYLPQDW